MSSIDQPASASPSSKTPPAHRDGVERLKAVVHDLRSPGGCPWDIEQTNDTLVTNMIEEAYEAVEAIRSGDDQHMEEELGDVLLQVVMHSEIASESGRFTLDSVAHGVSEKLIRRHPHVYGESETDTTEAVLRQWDEIKQKEKGGALKPRLEGVGAGLPALSRAAKLQRKVQKVGFDWPDVMSVIPKVREELDEVTAELLGDRTGLDEELGDLLFAVANLVRKCERDPEVLLAAANAKFVDRFGRLEKTLQERGIDLEAASLEEMETAWEEAKRAGC